MLIRPAHRNDIEQLTRLFDLYRVFYRKPSDPEGAACFLLERMQREESTIFVAEDEGELAGFAQLYPLFSSARLQKKWLLNDLYVLPEYRGGNISKLLIEACKQLVRETGAAGLALETEKSNTIGNNLYPSVGFELDETFNHYWWKNEQK